MIRRPSHSQLDAAVGMFPTQGIAELAYGVVKLTYDISGDRARLRDPEPLAAPSFERPSTHALAPQDDHALFKPGTDVIVLGDAIFPRPQAYGRVTVVAGPTSVSIDVIGPRRASWSPQQGARFSEPTPIDRMPMVIGNAYGGWDPRVPAPEPRSIEQLVLAQLDHPGVYPRNPVGKGYVVVPAAVEEVALPNLESPTDRLDPERFIVGDTTRWWRQPRPAFLGWRLANVFGRYAHLGIDPWVVPPDDDRLPEVASGELPAGFRRARRSPLRAIDPRFFHEAPAPLSLAILRPAEPVVVAGMHPKRERVGFAVPAPPDLVLELEGRPLATRPRLSSLVVRPAEQVATTTWVLRADRLHRRFIPGVHAEIPLALRIDGLVVPYLAPPPVHPPRQKALSTTSP